MLKNVYLAGAARTPIGTFNGAFSQISAPKLGGAAVKATLERSRLKPEAIEEVYFGNVLSAGLGQNVARQVALAAGLPVSCGAMTVNKVCGSAMRAIVLAAQAVQCGDAGAIIAGGAENMTQSPYLLPKARAGYKLGHGELVDAMLRDGLTDAYQNVHMAVFAEQSAKERNITRADQDDFGVESFKRLIAAQQSGAFKDVIVPVEVKGPKGVTIVDTDEEAARFNEEKFRQLKPVFDASGTITAGNASAISDGAASIAVLDEEQAKAAGTQKLARILGYANVALKPEEFPIAPIAAIRKLCDRLSLRIDAIDLFEINEAFSSVPIAAMRELNIPASKVDVLGGAVAMGHPIGASGARIVINLITGLQRTGGKIGIATACIGGGEASAIAIERVD